LLINVLVPKKCTLELHNLKTNIVLMKNVLTAFSIYEPLTSHFSYRCLLMTENAKEDQQIELKQASDASIDYPLMSSKFNLKIFLNV